MKTISIAALCLLLICLCAGACAPAGPVPVPAPEPQAESRIPPPASPSSAAGPSASIAVTRDFGSDVLLEGTCDLRDGISALEALQQTASVETKYGGGFVSSIEGIDSQYDGQNSARKDWFFYINGIASNRGAKDILLQPGDIEQWDFRDWSYSQFVPAMIGSFPQPFISGFEGNVRPTIIACQPTFRDMADSLAALLSDAGAPAPEVLDIQTLDEAKQGACNLILIASCSSPLIEEANANHQKLGLYAFFEDDSMMVLSESGEQAHSYQAGTGILQATQNPWNPKGSGASENVLWMLSGTDEEGIAAACRALVEHGTDLRYAYAAVVEGETVTRVPR